MSTVSVPFKIKDVFQGFAESHGILRLTEEKLEVEFLTKDILVGAVQSDVKNIAIPVSDIAEIDFKKSLFGSSMTIRLSKIGNSSQIPNQDAGEIKVSIDKKNIEAALGFVSAVKLEVVDHRIRELESQ